MAENNLGNTQYFRTKPDQELQVKEVLDLVYKTPALSKGMIIAGGIIPAAIVQYFFRKKHK